MPSPDTKKREAPAMSRRARQKLLFFHHHLNPGGVERQLYYLVNGCADHHDVSLLLCEKRGDFQCFIDARVTVRDLAAPFRHRLQWSVMAALTKTLRDERPDVLICLHGRLHWMAVLAARQTRTKVICGFPGYMSSGPFRAGHKLFFQMADQLVAVSDGVRNSLIDNIGIPGNKVRVIENAIDPDKIRSMAQEALSPEEQSLFEDVPVIVSIGRLLKGKGFDVLLEALADVRLPCRLLIVGDGPQRHALEGKIDTLRLAGKAVMLGSRLNPYKFLKRADLFVLASESEGLPTVILEAMCLGIPCICADYLGGTKGVMTHGENGCLVEANNAAQLKEALEYLLSPASRNDRRSFAEAGSALIREKFEVGHYVRNYLALIEEMR